MMDAPRGAYRIHRRSAGPLCASCWPQVTNILAHNLVLGPPDPLMAPNACACCRAPLPPILRPVLALMLLQQLLLALALYLAASSFLLPPATSQYTPALHTGDRSAGQAGARRRALGNRRIPPLGGVPYVSIANEHRGTRLCTLPAAHAGCTGHLTPPVT